MTSGSKTYICYFSGVLNFSRLALFCDSGLTGETPHCVEFLHTTINQPDSYRTPDNKFLFKGLKIITFFIKSWCDLIELIGSLMRLTPSGMSGTLLRCMYIFKGNHYYFHFGIPFQ